MYYVQVICPFNYKIIFEYYCTTKNEAVYLAETLRKVLAVEDVVLHQIKY